MKAVEIANSHKVTESYISHLRHCRKFADNIALAISISGLSGKKPIDHISKRVRKYVIAAHPELGKKVKSA